MASVDEQQQQQVANDVLRPVPPIPPRLLASLRRYVDEHVETGSFLRAVLENDLRMAVGLADDDSLAAIRSIVGWVYFEAPAGSNGSRELVERWIAARVHVEAEADPEVEP